MTDDVQFWDTNDTCLVFLNSWAGDSILCHLPGNRWVIVDANKQGDKVPVIEFLRTFSSPQDRSFVLAHLTHLHLDHYAGFSDVLKFLCASKQPPSSVRIPRSIEILNEITEGSRAGDPLLSLVEALRECDCVPLPTVRGPHTLGRHTDEELDAALFLWPHSLSASDVESRRYVEMWKKTRDFPTIHKRTLRVCEQRNCSVVALPFGDSFALLGGDCHTGQWAMMYPELYDDKFWITQNFPRFLNVNGADGVAVRRASIFKVPHHGSDRDRIPMARLELILERRRDDVLLPISIFLSNGRHHPGKNCLRDHCEVAQQIAVTDIPTDAEIAKQRRRAQSSLRRIAKSAALARGVIQEAMEVANAGQYPPVINRPARPFVPWNDSNSPSFVAFVCSAGGELRMHLRNFVVGQRDASERADLWRFEWVVRKIVVLKPSPTAAR